MKKIHQNTLRFSLIQSKGMLGKRQCGFTLVEVMVVIGIVAILTSMSLLGYQGYIRQVRDTQRITDMATLDSIILDFRRSTGRYPDAENEFENVVQAANDGHTIVDPLDTKVSCLTSSTDDTPDYCNYLYYSCDDGDGYILSAKFETSQNAQKYTQIANESAWYYHVGICTELDLPPVETVPAPESCRTKADCVADSVCVGPPPKLCRPKNSQSGGSGCDTNEECISNSCKKKVCEA